jgi:hypothetical protein
VAVIGHAAQDFGLEDTHFQGEAVGKVEIAQCLAGGSRVAYELLTGTNPFTQEQAATRRNPQRHLGHDHSGPPWGSAYLHPVVWWSWCKQDTVNVIRPTTRTTEDVIFSGGSASAGIYGPITFWNRPHASLPAPFGYAPYSALALIVSAHRKSATPPTVTAKVITIDRISGEETTTQDTFTITSTSTLAYLVDTAGAVAAGNRPACRCEAAGGRNTVRIEFTSSAASADAATIDGWCLAQMRKRRWLPT